MIFSRYEHAAMLGCFYGLPSKDSYLSEEDQSLRPLMVK